MAEQTGTTVVNGIIEAFNAGDLEGLLTLVTPNVIYEETGTGRRVQGVEDYRELLRGWRQSFSDVNGKVTSSLESGNRVAIEVTWTGTHDGPLPLPTGEVPPTGKSIEIQASIWCTLDGQKVAEIHNYVDVLTMLQQIGVL